MRFLSIDLRAFGPFTDTTLDLSGGREGLHIIYGPNEAGKSSVLRAVRSLLYGIQERTVDNYLHENAKLRIGGTLRHSDGTTAFFLRRKGRGNTLLDEKEEPVADSLLKPFLGNVEEALFVRLFGLSHEELVRGGKEIVLGHGDLGESLFAAGMGGTGLKAVLEGMKAEEDKIFRPKGSSQVIPALLGNYKDASKEVREASLSGADWKEHRDALQEAEQKKEQLNSELGTLRIEAGRLKRIFDALPLIAETRELDRLRIDIGDVLLLPSSFSTDRREAVGALQRAQESERKVASQQESHLTQLKNIPPAPAILDLGTPVVELYKKLGGHAKAMTDLPKLQGEWAQTETSAEGLLKDIRPGLLLADAEQVRLSAGERERIGQLIDRGQSIKEKISGAKRGMSLLQAKVGQAREELARVGETRNMAELRDAVRRIQKSGDQDEEWAKTKLEQDLEENQAEVELRKLPLWSGTIEALEVLTVPPTETVDRFETDLSDRARGNRDLRARIEDAGKKQAALALEIALLDRAGAVPTEADLLVARQRRQAGWTLVRKAWLDQTRDPEGENRFASGMPLDRGYEESVEQADEVADRLRREAERVERKASLTAQEAQTRIDIGQLDGVLVDALAATAGVEEQWRQLWMKAGLGETFPPREMRAWMQRQTELVRRMETIRKVRAGGTALEARIRGQLEELDGCLGRIGEPLPVGLKSLRARIDHCQALLDDHQKIETLREARRKALQGLEAQLAEASEEVSRMEEAQNSWDAEWAAICLQARLGEMPSPEEARVLIEKTRDLFTAIDAAYALRKRIEGIRIDTGRFEEEFRQVASRAASDVAALPVEQGVELLYRMLSEANLQKVAREQLEQQAEEKREALREIRVSIENEKAKLEALCRLAKTSDPAELEAIEKRSEEARGLDDQRLQLKNRLLAFSGSGSVEDLFTEADEIGPDSVPGKIRGTEERIQEMEKALSVVEQTIGQKRTELKQMDGSEKAADAAERARGFLGKIQEASERYVHLHLASAILQAEIERYRERNQGPILKRASEIFSGLTLGSFSHLKTDYDEGDRPVLKGQRPSGKTVGVDGMSDGTADQLYLSLRIAALEKHLAASEPLPLILDDILVNFDDRRAKATLKVLAALSEKTQVIYFTHHAHLLELAAKAVGPEKRFTVRLGEGV